MLIWCCSLIIDSLSDMSQDMMDMSRDYTVLVWCTTYNLYTFTWFVHFKLLFRQKGTDKIHTEGLFKFHSNIFYFLWLVLFQIFNKGFWIKLGTQLLWFKLLILYLSWNMILRHLLFLGSGVDDVITFILRPL